MYPSTCMRVSVYYVILQTSSTTHLYLSRRSMRLTVHIAFYNAIAQSNCFVKGSHKYDVYLRDKNKGHLI